VPAPDGGRAEVAPPVAREHDRLVVDEGPVHRLAANRLGDGRKSIGEVRPAAAPDLDAFALLQGGDAEAGPGGQSDWQAGRAVTGVGSRRLTTSVAL
jgi:hypothetical protein